MVTEWTISGEYAEACNCDVVCQCLWLEPPDDGACTFAIAWNITDGNYGDVDVSGRRVATLVSTDEGVLMDPATQWDMVLFVDDEATDEERDALEDIYFGRAGGIWAAVAETHVRSTESTTAPMEFERDGETTRVSVGGDVTMEVAEAVGFNEDVGEVYPHPFTSDMTMKTAKSTSATVSYDDQFDWDLGGNNAFVCDFELTNA
jgi:hypothetical protein